MPREIEYRPPIIEFRDRLSQESAGLPAPLDETHPSFDYAANRKTPFVGYARILTPEGGILIFYKDRAIGWQYTTLRVIAWLLLMALDIWVMRQFPQLSDHFFLSLGCAGALNWFLVTRKIKKSHSVEIRHDRMILDDKHVFWAADIGANVPQLEVKDSDNPDRMVIAGVCGTRWIEFMTANRWDANDRTPEVLVGDLHAAIQQLWARNELDLG